jgi:HEPN domain-containing protein
MGPSDKSVQYWIELSEYDLKVAESMLEKGHYIYVGFMCHQSVEKMLKAVYVKKHETAPPYIHKLDKLIELADLKESLTEEKSDLIDELTPLNIQARYPAYKDAIYKFINREKAAEILSRSGELTLWLKALLR